MAKGFKVEGLSVMWRGGLNGFAEHDKAEGGNVHYLLEPLQCSMQLSTLPGGA